ncbi:heparan-sulfate 6-O-sulfotransferase 3-B-like [Gordionus sp. m RMFG-2023]|uniref:heparan-sulfate 6-O-sulfotransferase 3-B-like n=1 Tax=Gordionus sp. m RMFG-2023 TaxID=3053472 RepID=UPI0031FCF883
MDYKDYLINQLPAITQLQIALHVIVDKIAIYLLWINLDKGVYYNQVNSISKDYNLSKPASEFDLIDDPIKPVVFNFSSDLLAFIHVQKTGGTPFEYVLTHDVIGAPICHCERIVKLVHTCICPRDVKSHSNDLSQTWLFSRFNDKSHLCGIHPPFIWVRKCLPIWVKNLKLRKNYKKKWKSYIKSNAIEIKDGRISGPGIDDNTMRKTNLESWSNNRMTRHFADFPSIECNKSLTADQKDDLLLKNAKHNLLNGFQTFGIPEYFNESRFLSHKMLGLNFSWTYEFSNDTSWIESYQNVSDFIKKKIFYNNRLDISLYAFARNLFQLRLKRYNYVLSGVPIN